MEEESPTSNVCHVVLKQELFQMIIQGQAAPPHQHLRWPLPFTSSWQEKKITLANRCDLSAHEPWLVHCALHPGLHVLYSEKQIENSTVPASEQTEEM